MLKSLASFASAISLAMTPVILTPSPVMAQAMTIDTQVVRGIWKEDARCNGPETMAFDGNAAARLGGQNVRYAVTSANEITFSGAGGTVPMTAAMLGPIQTASGLSPMRLQVTLQGTTGILYECGQSFALGGQAQAPAQVPNNSGGGTAATIAGLAILGGIAAIAGNSGSSGNQSSATSSGAVLTQATMSGKWTETNNCNDFIILDVFGDVSNRSGNVGSWTLSGSALNITTQSSGSSTALVQPLSNDQLRVTSQSGQINIWKRC